KSLPKATVVASDISDVAMKVAKRNFERLEMAERITLVQGDLFDAVGQLVDPQPFDIITANPPYIPSDVVPTLDANVRDYEPHLALDGGADGLDPHRKILERAHNHLRPGGLLYIEIAYDQGEAALALG